MTVHYTVCKLRDMYVHGLIPTKCISCEYHADDTNCTKARLHALCQREVESTPLRQVYTIHALTADTLCLDANYSTCTV